MDCLETFQVKLKQENIRCLNKVPQKVILHYLLHAVTAERNLELKEAWLKAEGAIHL